MNLKLLITSLFAFTVLADNTIIPLFKDLKNDATALKNSLNSFKGSLADVLPLTEKANTLVQAVNNGAATVAKADALSFDDAVALAQVTEDLKTEATQMIDTVIASKPNFDKLVVANGLVKGILNNLRLGIQALGKAVVAKVPEEVKPAASKLVDLLIEQIARGVAAYS